MLEAARAIQELNPDVTPFGWWATRGSGANHVFSSMTAFGVPFEGSIPDLQSEAGVAWIDFVQTMSREGLMHPEAIAWSDDEMRGGFVGSTIGMMLDSQPTSNDAIEAGLEPEENFYFMPMPTSRSGEEEEGIITAPARTWHITSTGAENNKYAASLFMRFLMEPDVMTAVTLQGGDPVRSAGLLDNEEFLSEVPVWPDESREAFANAGVFPVGTQFPAAQGVMEQLNQYVADNPDQDPEAVAEQWQAEFDAIGE